MQKDILLKNFDKYYEGIKYTVGEKLADKLVEALGGEEKIMSAPFFNIEDSGVAYEGAFTKNVIRLVKIAYDINDNLPEDIKVDELSINKVCLLSHISKVLLYEVNDNKWEVANRGMNYKFNNELKGALRVGERSTLIAMNVGVKFSELEFEAMRIMDKDVNDDSYSRYYSSPLSLIVRQANEILDCINRTRKNA